ncbi:hypothetical protein BOTBODRAFT_56326 [Botryobasidium botryosum FD-172 SS1]|uniref:Transcription factor IIIC putative zinc-finger domain-containing protein n=1 Tax=Botryobasidium botryosum (strain FD-172 SS1) TaxID=930990 RepID=A0A067MN58_BOTB1|nr:hypothetical protein BOTBODRAFT_56326 [Botryobasidium botryosum FD-172 SS1]
MDPEKTLQTYTALTVLTAGNPSSRTLQWSEDGQLLLMTWHAVYILTPDLGITFDLGSTICARPETGHNDTAEPLKWFRTLVELQRALAHPWAAQSLAYSTVAFGAADLAWRSASWSPTNLTPAAGCVLAALNSNMEVSIWAPVKNHLKGQWKQLQDITELMKNLPHPTLTPGPESITAQVLNSQTMSLEWSKQVDLDTSSAVGVDGSLLALGTRGGCVVLMRFDGIESMHHVETVHVAERWITDLCWTNWTVVTEGQYSTMLACAIDDGSIVIISISQELCVSEGTTEDIAHNVNMEIKMDMDPSTGDGKTITSIKWIEIERIDEPILVWTKPGTLHRWSSNPTIDPGVCVLPHPSSRSLPLLSPPCGMEYIPKYDALMLCASEGSFHVVHGISSELTLQGDNLTLSAESLNRVARSAFSSVEGRSLTKRDVVRMCGMTTCDSTGAVAWVHELTQPEEFAFKADAKHKSTLVVRRLWDDYSADSDGVLADVETILGAFKRGRAYSTNPSPLRGVLFRLRHPQLLSLIRDRLLDLLKPLTLTFGDDRTVPELPRTNSTSASRKWKLKEATARDLSTSEAFYTCQVKSVLASFCSKVVESGEANSFTQLAFSHERSIHHIRLHSLLLQIETLSEYLDAPDKRFACYLLTSFLLAMPPDNLRLRVTDTLMLLGPSFGAENVYAVPCPACKEALTMQNLETATCARGHTWGRCSVTFLVLATPVVRTCIGCRRKALLPLGSGAPIAMADSWVAQALLEAARRCLYCGNRFVQVL